MDPGLWEIVDRVMQWLIVPGIVMVWWLNQRQSTLDREILRILTILEERNSRRSEDRETDAASYRRLQASIDSLAEKLDRFIEALVKQRSDK